MIIIAITFNSCVKKPISLYTYKVLINFTNLSYDGRNLVPETKEDTVMAENDTSAYHKGLRVYLAIKLTKDRLEGKMGRVKGYKIVDSVGNSLDISLSKKVTDSLKKNYYDLNKDYIGAFN
ncbi:hypothetical protein [Pedobacter mendelii]|uniref:Uncharacterized protein n=1 Tax=Pedobacter mendelii TaxID=1908240 RepID=A0ABQ2BIH3_9SPHI|nr:hypothetical protein [Pedobacter mendelii]GGI25201.1 hypothetical protein GCM10008119_16470 [Pedobacter mendelii]